MNVGSWLKQTRNRIDAIDAELILLYFLSEDDRSFLVSHDDLELSLNDEDVLEKLVQLRERHMPIAYITGKKEFFGRDFCVNRDVLIPRPESEAIIDIVKKLVDEKKIAADAKILDVGTGSGCLGVTVALEFEEMDVTAVDVSLEALEVAMHNALSLGAGVKFFQSDLLTRVKDKKFDVVMANLPYVDAEWDFLNEDIEWEPELALFAEDGGLDVIYRLIDDFVEFGVGKFLILEADTCQHEKIKKFAIKKGLKFVEALGFQLLFVSA